MVKISKFIDNYIGKIICLLLPRSTDKDRTLFIQWWGMGESILTLPAIKFYAEAHPDKYIHILCSERNKEVFEGHKFIDELHIIKFNPLSMIRFIIKYFYYFQEVYDFEEYQNSSALIAYFVGREVHGFNHGVRARLYNDKVYFDDSVHTAYNFGKLVGLNIYNLTTPLVPVTYTETDKEFIDSAEYFIFDKHKKLIVLFPFVAESCKQREWPLGKFKELKKKLEKKGYNVFIQPKEHIFNLHQLAYLVSKAEYVVSNDSGPMHLSACMGVKTIGLFGANLSSRWAPLGKDNVSIYHPHECSPCIDTKSGKMHVCKKCEDMMDVITVEEVLEYIK